MAFAFVSYTTYDSSSSNSASINAPTGVQNNDLLLTVIKHGANELPNSVPSGWTLLGSDWNSFDSIHVSLYSKVAASEGASYSWGWATAARTAMNCVAYRDGFDTADPIDAVSNTAYITSNTTVRAAAMTVSAANSPIIFIGYVGSSTTQSFTPPSSPSAMTENVDWWGSGGGRSNFTFASVVWSGSGSTGNMDATNTATTASKHAFAVALNPPAATGQPTGSRYNGIPGMNLISSRFGRGW